MARIVKLRDDISIDLVQKQIKTTSDGIFRLRLMIIEKLLSTNLSLNAVAKSLIVNRETVAKCLNLFNKGGLEALKPKKAGRKEGNPKYDNLIFKDLINALKTHESWSTQDMKEYIKNKAGLEIPESTIYYRLSKLGYSKRANNELKSHKKAVS